MIEFSEARKIAGMLAAVGEPTRLLLLQHLSAGPRHVGQLAELVGVPMVNTSHHLGVLRQAGFLDDVKDGRRVVYSLRADVFTPGGGADVLGVLRVGRLTLTLVKPGAAAVKKKPAGKKPRP